LLIGNGGTDLAKQAAANVVAEASQQGVDIDVPAKPGEDRLRQTADAVASVIASGYASGAARSALQLAGASPQDVRDAVEAHLTELGTSTNGLVGDNIGALLSAAQHAGRLAVLEEHPASSYRAVETLDSGTCQACKDADGTRFPTLAAALTVYPAAGNAACAGGLKCRGYIHPQFV
jgi:hypothetical protein